MEKSQRSITIDKDIESYVDGLAKRERLRFSTMLNRILVEYKSKNDEKATD